MYQHKAKISCDTKEKVSKCKASTCLISSASTDYITCYFLLIICISHNNGRSF